MTQHKNTPDQKQFEIMYHALGLEGTWDERKPWRNHFAAATGTDDYTICESLVSLGFMEKGGKLGYGDYFHVTNAGKEAALAKIKGAADV